MVWVHDRTYNGKAQNPTVAVKNKSKTLKAGRDYTLSYRNNKNVGQASVTVRGKGNYTGSVTLYFKIRPQQPKAVSAKSKKAGSMQVQWKKVTQASGYQLTYASNK